MNSPNNLNSKDSSNPILSPKSSEINTESEINDQSFNNLNSFLIDHLDNAASDQNDLDLILDQDNMSNEYSLDNKLQKTTSQLLEENQKFVIENKRLVIENQKLKKILNELKKSQNSSVIDSLEHKNNDLVMQIQNITEERDELKRKVLILTTSNNKLKGILYQNTLHSDDQFEENENSNEHLINISNVIAETNSKSIAPIKDPEALKALDLIENVISSQSDEIAFVSMQKFTLFELLKKLIDSNKELENQLQESIEYASKFEKEHITLAKKCTELQDKTDIEMDYLLSSIISISTNYLDQKRLSKKSNKSKLRSIFDSLNIKIQTKLSNIQDLTLSNQIIELFQLIMSNFYDTCVNLIKPESQNSSLIFPSIINDRDSHTKKEIALLGHLENAIKYIQDITSSSKTTMREDERTCVIAQVSRMANFINEEIDPETIKNVTSLFKRENLESQILTFFEFVNQNDDDDDDDDSGDNNNSNSKELKNKSTENFEGSYEEDEDDVNNDADFRSIRKAESRFVEIKSTPIRELYSLFKAVLVVNSIMFDHFDHAAEDIVHLKSELSSARESKARFEQQYNRIAERVDEMSSDLGRFFYSIQQQQQQQQKQQEKKKATKGNKNAKNKRRKESKNEESISASDFQSTDDNPYPDDPFQSVSELIQMFDQLQTESNNHKQTIKNLKRKVNEVSKKDAENAKIEELESQNLQLKNENNEIKEKFTNVDEMTKENSELKKELSEVHKIVEILQTRMNKMREKMKDDENKATKLTQQLQISQEHNKQLTAQFNNLKDLAIRSANVMKSYKEKERRLATRILNLESQLSQTEINETTQQREIDKAKKIQKLQSKQNEEAKEKYESQLKELNEELQTARTKILQMEEEAEASAKSKDSLQRDVAKLKLAEKTLEMKLKQQEAHSLSMVSMERGKCESKILMAKSQIEECLNEHQKRLSNIKLQLLQIVKEFFPESYNAAVASSALVPSVLATETTAIIVNNAFSRSPNQKSTESEISIPANQYSPSQLDYFSNRKNASVCSSPQSNQSQTPNSKPPIFSFLSPPSQQQQQQQQQRQNQMQSQSSSQQFSSPATFFASASNAADQVFCSPRPFASLDRICDSVEASLDSVRTCVSRSDFHNNVSTVQEANKVRAQLGLKSSASLLKKFDEMREKINELEEEKNMYKEKFERCNREKRKLEIEFRKNDTIRNELKKWEVWGQAVFRQINDDMALVSTSKSTSLIRLASANSSACSSSSSVSKALNGSNASASNESDLLELNDLMTTAGRKTSPFKVIPLLTNDEIRAALENSVLASIGHREVLRKVSLLRVQKRIIDRAYQNLFELLKPLFMPSKSKGNAKVTISSEGQLALRELRKNYGYFFCFMLKSNVRFSQLNQDQPNSQYALCSIRHLILIYVFIKRITKYSGLGPIVGSNSIFLSNVPKEDDKRPSLIEFDD